MEDWKTVETDIEGIYQEFGSTIKPIHNYLNGSKNYAIATIEHMIGQLSRQDKNDDLLIFLNNSLLDLINIGEENYYQTIRNVHNATGEYDDVEAVISEVCDKFSWNVMSEPEKAVIAEIANMNINEYWWKSDNKKCDYFAMKTLTSLAYEVLKNGLDKFVSSISIAVDTDGVIKKWKLDYVEEKRENIWIDWISLDKIDHYSTIYDVNYGGLTELSRTELASADAYENEYINTEKRIGSYGILVKQYCGVIEQEINQIIKLYNDSNNPNQHLMWNDLKAYVKKNDIQLIGAPFDLSDMLSELHRIRNLAMHGENITKEDFEILDKYRKRQLFEWISWTKLELKGEKFHPTVDELQEKYFDNC
ncbi:hypothetical protein LAV60_04250 [Clostridium sporogenes]|uniref:Uncharacterized protein n=1 Tax=Clostridium sporogenes TaxID=1509 RepID=A0A7U4JPE8_CLOSG|nr:hypothetical protein [Clostridium sporogenes]AKC62884.1 hypothetical protein CLSPO_c21640 [Clostridium sporogenes]AKJ90125.1 hypothetical protein CLSPOx_10890 [Clostridium sporogenes]KCZ68262.1 hypothetical protein CSPO_6c03050 [Clostridium sporogenes]MCW6092381.1 hypothetical protein [Clostridium sporogenes]OOO65390.1 hypothetical protein BS099_16055 [Clostridium sporogenes]